jgi:hypothetical protein
MALYIIYMFLEYLLKKITVFLEWKICPLRHIVTYRPIARQRLGKHIPTEANSRNIRSSITRKRISKHASLTTEGVFSVWSVQSGYKEGFDWEELVVFRSWDSLVEEEFIGVSCCRELGRVLEMAVQGDCEERARKELDRAKKTSCVLQLQWDWYNYCVEIRYQDTTREDWEI